MPLIPKHDVNQIFASQAPSIDQPPEFKSYTGGWGVESRPNNGKPTIKGFNKLQQITDEKLLWIHQNGAALPFDENMEYAENAPVVKDGVLVQKKGSEWKPVGANKASDILDESGLTQQEWNNGVAKQSDLLLLANAKDGNRVFVKSIQQWFTYTPNTQETDNSVTIVGKWVMDVPSAYYASWFAKPNIKEDQSSGLRLGYSFATSKKRTFIIDGHFYVDSSISSGDPNGNPTAIKTLSNSVMWFFPNGKIEHLPTNKGSYNILHTLDVENFVIYSPNLIGERYEHIGTDGEWGYLLTIYQSKNGYIHNPHCSNAWGDGIYIGKAAGTVSNDLPTNITIFEPILENCRRNNMSFTGGDNVKIIRPIFKNAGGIAPEAGLDIEPEEIGVGAQYPSAIKNSIIESPTFINNVRNLWVSWYGANRHIDIRFTGVTKIIGGDYPFTIYARSFSENDKQTGMINFECIDYTCTNSSGKFETELMFEDRGASFFVEKLIIRDASKWMTHFVRFGDTNKPLKGLTIRDIYSTSLKSATFANTSVGGNKETLKPSLVLGFDEGVLVITDPDNDGAIQYGDTDIGGYSYQEQQLTYSKNLPSSNILIKPLSDSALYTQNDYRKLKVTIESQDTSVNRTLYIHQVNATLIDGTSKSVLTLQGKGANITLKNNLGKKTEIFNLYGSLS